MDESNRQKRETSTQSPKEDTPFAVPSISLPKGGGAIRGMGEKFAANPVTGTGSLSVPIFTSPGRAGFGPQLSLGYDSGSGNSPFGFGWSLDLPSITRKTDKGLPQYRDEDDSDVFLLSGTEDLMPVLALRQGKWTPDVVPSRTVDGKQYAIHRYRPRVEGLFARIERWVNLADPRDTFWRSISKDNITTWYGKTMESRIADPSDPSRVFTWLICESSDGKGNAVSYQYKPEDSAGVDLSQANERNRSDLSRSAKRYINSVSYGNRTPYLPDLTAGAPTPLPTDWCFQVVFDYGEHDEANPTPRDSARPWPCRPDPFSTYRSTFEVRTYRLCRRVLMFHHFADQPDVGLDCLVRSTDLVHAATLPSDPSQPAYSYLLSAKQTAYVRQAGGGYFSRSLPPSEFRYTTAEIDETVRDVDAGNLANLPYGIDGSHYRWVDLDGEGLSGILTEQGGSWYYKPNLSPANQRQVDGELITLPCFGEMRAVRQQPSTAALSSGRQQLMDLSGDGKLDVVQFEGPISGFYERTEDETWEPFQTFPSLPAVDWHNPNLKFVDLTGDGFADILIGEGNAFSWHASFGAEGFGAAQRVAQSFGEEEGPRLVFSDGTESIFLADISGDGLTDLVRIRNGEVCYWPNLGYGRFGAKVAMDHAPRFDRTDCFDGRRIHLTDIDGSGTADIIYFAGSEVQLYFNQSGNAWGPKRALSHYPSVDSVSSASAFDLLGNGTACLVWSSPLTGNERRPMRYIDLMGGQKPHLLVSSMNNLGAETVVRYAPSTKFYVADKLAGTPWLTRLPFPVHVVERVETYDYISRNRFVTRYTYHHGYFDGFEREFRGFGRVDQWDTEEFGTLSDPARFPQGVNEDPTSTVPPTLSKTWFHTGAFFGEPLLSKHLEPEYYSESGLSPQQLESMLLSDTIVPKSILLPDGSRIPYDLSGEEMREACRALHGSILRQEIYALDDTAESARPYSASERNYTIEVLQPQGSNRFAVFLAHARETIDYHYERKLYKVGTMDVADPRVLHSMVLAVDSFGNVLQSVAIGYGRRHPDPDLVPADQAKQAAILATLTVNSYTNPILADDSHRAPLPAESSTYELLQVKPKTNQTGVTSLFGIDELQGLINAASDGKHEIAFEDFKAPPADPSRRLLGRVRTLYRPDDMGAAAGDPNTVLALGKLEPLALPGVAYKLAFTPGLISQVYQRNGVALLPDPASVLGSRGPDGGGYVNLDSGWWIPSGRAFYSTAIAAVQEKTDALKSFFLPRRFVDPFGNTSTVEYDAPHNLFVAKTADPLANVVTASYDYRVLAPKLVTDPNGNRTAAVFDVLGMVAGSAVMGKTTENLGDNLTAFTANLSQTQIDDFHDAADPHTLAAALLGTATTRVVYDVSRFYNSRRASPLDPVKWLPPFAAVLARETHVSDLAPGQQTKIQISFSYTDGFGREAQKKIQAEPGPVVDNGPTVNPRWVGSGWTVFNNKGKPVRQYEPFFSQLPKGHQFEFGLQVGVSSILCYDPADRVVATIHPNHSYEKVVFDPWRQESWDVNDTVSITDPTKDPNVGGFFSRLPREDFLPTWHALRTGATNSTAFGAQYPNADRRAEQTVAAAKAAAHAATPGVAHADSLGRTFVTVAHNKVVCPNHELDGTEEKFHTWVVLDIQGFQREVIDPKGRVVMHYSYDLSGNRIHQTSMETGSRWMLNEATDKSIRSWDSRDHAFRSEYDPLRRLVRAFVTGADSALPAQELLTERITYGEQHPEAQKRNLRAKPYLHLDQAGALANEARDFKGNLLQASRRIAKEYKRAIDWSSVNSALPPMSSGILNPLALEATLVPMLEGETFTSSTVYDALNRPITITTPHSASMQPNVIRPAYNEANFLDHMDANLRGATANGQLVWTSFITNIDYDAKGQRQCIDYGNGVTTTYQYDPLTFRLVKMTTTRDGVAFPGDCPQPPPAGWPGCNLQNLNYAYDPAGNITSISDEAQQAIYFKNQRVEPCNSYTYDATYRLIEATGREHLGQDNLPIPHSHNDAGRVSILSAESGGRFAPNDGSAMGTYTERYVYDAVGNFLAMQHRGSNLVTPGWSRLYAYNEASLIEPGKQSNRLSRTTIGNNNPFAEPYVYDAHGNMVHMPHLQAIEWDFKDQLHMTRRQAVDSDDVDGVQHRGERTYYVYDGRGERARKATELSIGGFKDERIYLGGVELYRRGGTNRLMRETLHIMDGKQRIALVETRTDGTDDGPQQLIRYQFGNHLGTISVEVDDEAQIISHEEYTPYGSTSYQAVRYQTETPKRYRYTGKERDEESMLYYHGARYYAPWLGIWISYDPVSDFNHTSLYKYAADNPISFHDPDGRQPETGAFTPAPAAAHAHPLPGPPPGVSAEQYNASQRKADALQARLTAASRAGQLAGADVGESLAYAREAMSKDGFFRYEELKKRGPAGAAQAQKLAQAIQADIDRALAKFPNYADPLEQASAKAAFQVAVGQSFEQTRLELGVRKIAFQILMVAGAAALERASLLLIQATARQLVGPMLRTATIEAAESAIAAGRKVDKVVAGVTDLRTGQSFFALNAEGLPTNLHPILQARVQALLKNPQHFTMAGSHAEVHALNQALWARTNAGMKVTEANLGEFVLDTAWLSGSGKGFMVPLQPAPRCGNCAGVTEGVINMAGDAPPKPPVRD
jgi:RHS repeat-associated protein